MAWTATKAHPFTAAGEGTNNRKLQDTAPGSSDSATVANFGTSTTRRSIQFRPGVSNSTAGTPGAATDFGWNILKAEMNRTANLPARAKIEAGVWTFDVTVETTGADAVGAAAVVTAYVYRRGAAGAYTLLFSAPSGNISVALGGVKNVAQFASAAQPDFLFDTDETLHVEYWVAAQGVALTGNQYRLLLGTGGAPVPGINLPAAGGAQGVYSEALRTVSATAAGVASMLKRVAVRLAFSATGVATVARRLTLFRVIDAGVTGAAEFARQLSLARTITAATTGTANVVNRQIFRRGIEAATTGLAVMTRLLAAKRTIDATTVGVPTLTKRITKRIEAAAVGVASLTRALTLRRTISAATSGLARIFAKLPIERIPGGGTPLSAGTYSRARVVNK